MRTRRHATGTDSGFTLLELMIAVAIVGIIVAIGYPNYVDHVRKSRRTEATAALQEAMNRQERFYTTENQYTADVTDLNYASDPFTTQDGWYEVSAGPCAGGTPLAQCVELEAEPVAGTDQTNDVCGTFILDSTGRRDIGADADPAMTADACW